MVAKRNTRKANAKRLEKSATGIKGFDEITGGGLPKGRPTLISGGAGSGKTTFAMEFLLRGALQFKEPGVFVSFEENEEELGAGPCLYLAKPDLGTHPLPFSEEWVWGNPGVL